ncbi:MAG: TonB C-terminal domain-containing protein [Acidobacteria bacterium]|nr:TonB C-terminal domain-containing protein [Acidobacteriota bacterium]
MIRRLSLPDDRLRFPLALLAAALVHLILFAALSLPFLREILATPIGAREVQPPQPIRFTFVNLPEEDRVEAPPESRFWSDANRRARGERPAEDAEESTIPYSRGNTSMVEITTGGAEPSLPGSPSPSPSAPPPAEGSDSGAGARTTVAEEEGPAPLDGAGPDASADSPDAQEERLREALREVSRLGPEGFDAKFDSRTRAPLSDFGGLSFETRDFDWGDYARVLVEIIRRNWRIPLAVQHGEKGKCAFLFTIERDGRISGIEPVYSSGKAPLDHAAEQALAASNPVPPLPEGFPGERERVTVHFYYNLPLEN